MNKKTINISTETRAKDLIIIVSPVVCLLQGSQIWKRIQSIPDRDVGVLLDTELHQFNG